MRLTLLIGTLLLTSHLQAQDPPIKWGEIDSKDLAMKEFPADTNAAAVVLCDYGESKFNDDMYIVFTRHVRVKMLNERGYRRGTFAISVHEKDGDQRVKNIEGVTYTLDAKGKTVEQELDDDNIFKEKNENGWVTHKFTMPGLTPGCIIEVRYKIITQSLFRMSNWVFQDDEPVLWSEYRMATPSNMAYVVLTQGYVPFDVREEQVDVELFGSPAAQYIGSTNVKVTHRRWAIKNIPAFRNEPLITTAADYVNRIQVQLGSYFFVGTGVVRVLNDWPTMIKDMAEDKEVGRRGEVTSDVRTKTNEVIAGISVPLQKVEAIHRFVSNSIVWDGTNTYYASDSPDDVLESKKGTSGEINLLTVSMLNAAGFEAYPVVLSTRSHGKIADIYPMLSQFNYVVARVNVDSRNLYLDATSSSRPYDLLPSGIQNVKGLLIKPHADVQWVEVGTAKRSSRGTQATLRLLEDGSAEGSLEVSLRDFAAPGYRSDLKKEKAADVAQRIFDTESSQLAIDSVSFADLDSLRKPLIVRASVKAPTFAQAAGDKIYVNPMVVDRFRTNPFSRAKREFDIDYTYERRVNTVINLEIPAGYEATEMLKDRAVGSSGDDFFFSRRVSVDSLHISIVLMFTIGRPVISVANYAALREFYSRVIETENEQFVLQRRPPPPPVVAVPPSSPSKQTLKKAGDVKSSSKKKK